VLDAGNPVLRIADFRRYWGVSILNSFGEQISALALPLTAVLLLHATPSQMGVMVALQAMPYVLFSLPVGVWLDRRAKFPILLRSEIVFPFVLGSVPLGYWLGKLSMPWMYTVAFCLGTAFVVNGTASQVFLTHLVGRRHLIDAHSKFAATDSAARLLGPGMAGALVQWLTAPFALLVQCVVFLFSFAALGTIRARDARPAPVDTHPVRDIVDGLKFVRRTPVLWTLAWGTALWQLLYHGAVTLNVLFATRTLGMSPGVLGAAQMLGGFGVLASSMLVKPMTRRYGTGVTLLMGLALAAFAWTLLALTPVRPFGLDWGSAACYGAITFLFDCGVMLYFMPYLALRQMVTPDAYLGRVVATMRCLNIAGAPVGALTAGALGEWLGLRGGIACVAAGAVGLALLMTFHSPLRTIRADPHAPNKPAPDGSKS
jgi:MFS family permease